MQKFKMILGVWMWVVVLLWGCQNKVKKSNLEMIPVDMDRAREVGVSDVFSEIDSSGHFLYRIDQQGRGENEYRGINGMAGNPYLPVLYLN